MMATIEFLPFPVCVASPSPFLEAESAPLPSWIWADLRGASNKRCAGSDSMPAPGLTLKRTSNSHFAVVSMFLSPQN